MTDAPKATTASSRPAVGREPAGGTEPSAAGDGTPWYSWYSLGILLLCYLFNYVDRNILSILAEEVKRDLGLSDARIGFLYGTAFAVFYAVFGIPFGRLADGWVRKNLIAIGLFFWSTMTALTGTARSFGQLAAYRVGVGVGEASLSPAAYSLIVDLFPQRLRATALALYSSGITLGAGIGFFLGGWIVDTWNRLFSDGPAPLGLAAWQAAFIAVGLPGVILALWVWTLREPVRGQRERPGTMPEETRRPEPLREFASVLPPLTLLALWRAGARAKVLSRNLGIAALLAVAAWLASLLMGEPAQWIAMAVGLYAAASWAQTLRLRDAETFRCILGNRAFVYAGVGFASLSFVTNGMAFWTAPYLLRAFGASPTRVGALMGIGAAVGGWIGVTAGGMISDRLKLRRPSGRVDIGVATVLLGVPLYALMLFAPVLNLAFVAFLLFVAVAALWLGPGAACVNELVPARMRSTASAIYLLLNTFIGFALGPYAVGKVSDALGSAGQSPAEALRWAMLASTLFWLVSLSFLLAARRLVGGAEAAVDVQSVAAPPAPSAGRAIRKA